MLVHNPLSITHRQLYTLAQQARGKISHLYLHWTAGHYGQAFDDYHINIDRDGQVYQTCAALTSRKSHTYRRNTGSIGIALCCAYGASCGTGGKIDFGPEPPTAVQIEKMAQVIALLSMALHLPISFSSVMTHAEAACIDGYGPGSGDSEMRWDLLLLSDQPQTSALRPGGVVLRGKALWYYELYRQRCLNQAA